MRIGSYVPHASTPSQWVQHHIERGLGAAYWPLPVDASPQDEAAYVQAAQTAGLVIAEVGIWNNLLESDPLSREENIAYAINRLAQAERVGARCCVNVSGSRSKKWDGPDLRNLHEDTFAKVVATTQQIIDAVNPVRTAYSLEPMPYMLPYDLDSLQRLLDAVNRPAFKVHVDMVNILNSFDRLMNNGAYTQSFFDRFGSHIRSVHAKDVVLQDTLTLHIDEALPGDGMFDFDTLLTACAKLHDIPVMAEHLKNDQEYSKAILFLQGKAKELGLAVDGLRLRPF